MTDKQEAEELIKIFKRIKKKGQDPEEFIKVSKMLRQSLLKGK